MGFLIKLRNKFGKYAIKGLTKYIIATYVIGYLILIVGQFTGVSILQYLALNPGAIMRGEVWRLITWVLMPPTSLDIFTFVMLLVYYQLGTLLERVWGDYFYNLYIFFGLICTVIGAFVIYFVNSAWVIEATAGMIFTTYYVSLSIFLGFAMTFPNQMMLFMFIIPIRIKYLALFDVAYLIYNMVTTSLWVVRVQIVTSLASAIVLIIIILSSRNKNKARANAYKQAYNSNRATGSGNSNKTDSAAPHKKVVSQGQAQKKEYFHKCHICGQTDVSNPELEFRFCSKCNGYFEYCQNHLFTHEHIK